MSRNFQPFQKIFTFTSNVLQGDKEPISRLSECEILSSVSHIGAYGEVVRLVRLRTGVTGDVRVSKIVINEIQDVDTLGTKDIVLSFITTDINGNHAKTEFKYTSTDTGAKVFNLTDGELSLVPEDLVKIRLRMYFGTDPTLAGGTSCIDKPTAGKLRIMITFELPRA